MRKSNKCVRFIFLVIISIFAITAVYSICTANCINCRSEIFGPSCTSGNDCIGLVTTIDVQCCADSGPCGYNSCMITNNYDAVTYDVIYSVCNSVVCSDETKCTGGLVISTSTGMNYTCTVTGPASCYNP